MLVVWFYVCLDTTHVKARVNGLVAGQAAVIAIGLNAQTSQREVLRLDVDPSKEGAFWLAFLRGLVARGLSGVQPVVSDAHERLKTAAGAILVGASWQRCRVHFVRNALALVPRSAAQLVAETIHTVFAQPEPEMARATWRQVADGFRPRYPKLAALLDAAEADMLAYLVFPPEHWRQIWSNNPLERLNREVKRRTDVVASSLTRRQSSAWRGWGWPSNMMNGRWDSATSAPSRSQSWRRRVWRRPRR